VTVADTYGLLAIPVAVPAADQPVGDPVIGVLLEAFQAVLNAHISTAWGAAGIAPNIPTVRASFGHDPNKVVFSERDLPALFLWRDGSAIESFDQTADRRIATDTLKLIWVFPAAKQEPQRRRAPVTRAVVAVIDGFLKRNRDPAWIATGDASARAALDGSNLTTTAGFWSLRLGRVSHLPVVIEMADESPRRSYEALQMELVIEEAHTIGGMDVMGAAGSVTIQTAELDGNGDPFVYAELELPV